jgi:hypothetical protein
LTLLTTGPHAFKSAIVYVTLTKTCRELADFLNVHSVTARSYYGSMPDADKVQAAMLWGANNGKCQVVVATRAFGRGINNLQVRQVIHFDFSMNMADLYQEIGRAGRDEKYASATIFFDPADRLSIEKLHKFGAQDAFTKRTKRQAIDDVIRFCTIAGCRAHALDRAVTFNAQGVDLLMGTEYGNRDCKCDNCRLKMEFQDVTPMIHKLVTNVAAGQWRSGRAQFGSAELRQACPDAPWGHLEACLDVLMAREIFMPAKISQYGIGRNFMSFIGASAEEALLQGDAEEALLQDDGGDTLAMLQGMSNVMIKAKHKDAEDSASKVRRKALKMNIDESIRFRLLHARQCHSARCRVVGRNRIGAVLTSHPFYPGWALCSECFDLLASHRNPMTSELEFDIDEDGEYAICTVCCEAPIAISEHDGSGADEVNLPFSHPKFCVLLYLFY